MMIRLQKFIAASGIASRRAAEIMIRNGEVTVNGAVMRVLGTRVDPFVDHVKVNGRHVRQAEPEVFVLLHKPAGYVTTMSDPHGRHTVADLLAGIKVRVVPVGRLDYDAEGLLLLTNNGMVAQACLHPRHHVPKTYLVKVSGLCTDEEIQALQNGVALYDGVTAPAVVKKSGKARVNSWLEITIHEGKTHQVKRMIEAIGHRVGRIQRIGFGPLMLGALRVGTCRFATDAEANALRALLRPPTRSRNSPRNISSRVNVSPRPPRPKSAAPPVRTRPPASPTHSRKPAPFVRTRPPAFPDPSRKPAPSVRTRKPAFPDPSRKPAPFVRTRKPAFPDPSRKPAPFVRTRPPAFPDPSRKPAPFVRTRKPAFPDPSRKPAPFVRTRKPAFPDPSRKPAPFVRTRKPAFPDPSRKPAPFVRTRKPAFPAPSRKPASSVRTRPPAFPAPSRKPASFVRTRPPAFPTPSRKPASSVRTRPPAFPAPSRKPASPARRDADRRTRRPSAGKTRTTRTTRTPRRPPTKSRRPPTRNKRR